MIKSKNKAKFLLNVIALLLVGITLFFIMKDSSQSYVCIDIYDIKQKAIIKIKEQKISKEDTELKYRLFIQDLNDTVIRKSNNGIVVDRTACLFNCNDISDEINKYYGLNDVDYSIEELPTLKSLKPKEIE